MQLPQLRRIRWAVRIALTLGVSASVATNVLHALPNPISQAIAAWPPLALLLTVELTSRIPMHRRSLAACRVFATVAIAGIAAWVSYWHMASVAARYGETEMSAYLLPISVDGLIVVASVSLVELAGRIRMIEEQRNKTALAAAAATAAGAAGPAGTEPAAPRSVPQPVPAPPPVFATTAAPPPVPTPAANPTPASTIGSAPVSPAVVPVPRVAAPQAGGQIPQWVNGTKPAGSSGGRVVSATSAPVRPTVTSQARPAAPAAAAAAPATTAPAASVEESTEADTDGGAPRQRRPVQETAALADAIEAMHPNISQTELARQLGISATRLRAVRREAREIRRSQRLRSA